MNVLNKYDDSSSCPTVIVVGGASAGKSTVIDAVVHGCNENLSKSASSTGSGITCCISAATSFIEIDPSAYGTHLEQTKNVLERIRQADAVWFVLRAGDVITGSQVELYKKCCECTWERLLVITHVDVVDEVAQRETKERMQTFFRDLRLGIDDGHVCLVNVLQDGRELTARYMNLLERKRLRITSRRQSEQQAEYDRFVQNGLLEFDFERYRDSVNYYCMSHDPESEAEFAQTAKPPFKISDKFRERIRLVLQTPVPNLYLEHPDLYDISAKGYDLIQTIKFGCEYWRDNAVDEEISAKAKCVVDKLEEFDCEMGVAEKFPPVTEYVIEILDYADRELKRQKWAYNCDMSASGGVQTASSQSYGEISGYELVERILDGFEDDGVAKLLECTHGRETEFLEFKTSYLLSEEEKKRGISQDSLTWDVVQAIFAIANTSGGALLIGICDDGKSLHPVNVAGDEEKFLRCQIMQKILPDQRCWSDGKGGRWNSRELPKVEPRLCHYSDGTQTGYIVVLLIGPQSRGRSLSFEDLANRNGSLLCYREKGYGKTQACKDSVRFGRIDNERRIQRNHYLMLLRKFIPDAGQSANGHSSGAYRLKPVAGRDVDTCNDEVIVSTDGHRLRYQFEPNDVIGKYCVIEKLGQGGMGVVYRVKDTRFGREYALKAFMSTVEECQMQKERFITEARLLDKFEHEGLPKVHYYDFDEQRECLYLVEDLIVGADNKPHELARFTCLQSVARDEGLEFVSNEQCLKWLRQVCEVTDYLHKKGVGHRDITLKNLLVTKDGCLKLTDFGIAKVVDEKLKAEVGADVTMTFTQTPNGRPSFLGTLHYLPPEVKNKKKDLISPETTDVWAIGVCFFKLLTGDWFEYQQFEEFDWDKGVWGKVLRGMLKVDSGKRMKCRDVLKCMEDYDPESLALWSKVVLVDGDDFLRSNVGKGGKVLFHLLNILKEHYDTRVYFTPDAKDWVLRSGYLLDLRYLNAIRQATRWRVIDSSDANNEMLGICQAHRCSVISNDIFWKCTEEYYFSRERENGNSPIHRYTVGDKYISVDQFCSGTVPAFDEVMPEGE